MKYWLQSFVENGFEVFIVVYLATLTIAYHFLNYWDRRKRLKDLEENLREYIEYAIDEVVDR